MFKEDEDEVYFLLCGVNSMGFNNCFLWLMWNFRFGFVYIIVVVV